MTSRQHRPQPEVREEGPATYASAGVDIAAGEAAVERIKEMVASTARPEVLGGIGGFGGAFTFDPARYDRPVLVASTDGVGTKALVAQAVGRYDTIGIDLVAMCVDDLVCVGAEPLFLLDYVAVGKLDPEQMEQLVAGVADGCRQAGCALLGGEMAEHAGAMGPGGFDIAGFALGAVDRDDMLGPEHVVAGDVLVGLASPGLRSNGYTLARHVLFERAGRSLEDQAYEGAGHSLGDELLRPSVIYAPAVLAALGAAEVHAAAHVTGGGISQNLARALPPRCDAVVDRSGFETPRIFSEIQRLGNVDDAEMARVFNLGIGMLLVVAPGSVDEALGALEGAGCRASVAGRVVEGAGRVRLEA
jgi:phosphoribosylformylglycinamidine cyclo-ligase